MTDLRKLAERARAGEPWAIAHWNQGAVTLDHYLAVLDERDALRAEYQLLRKLVTQAMHLAQHGERAPGGDETWPEWYGRAREALEAGT